MFKNLLCQILRVQDNFSTNKLHSQKYAIFDKGHPKISKFSILDNSKGSEVQFWLELQFRNFPNVTKI